MRLLLIAYEFPPSPSPQSLRWSHLVRELLELGVEVHVLTAENWWPPTSTRPPAGAVMHRAWPGGVAGIIALSRRWRRLRGRPRDDVPAAGSAGGAGAHAGRRAEATPAAVGPAAAATLNWKGRAVDRLNRVVRRYTFPDERGRWEPHARSRLGELLDTLQPDVVISSHEPATTLRLGRIAKEAGFPWVADLGDPVFSFYTPQRWKEASLEVERWTCTHADRVIVTTRAAKSLLAERHGVAESRLEVLTQGFDGSVVPAPAPAEFDPGRLELLYTGSFYQFREPRALVDAVLATPGARLSIATSRAPDWLPPLLEAHPDQLRLLGFMPHAQAVALQRSADVLVNIANDDPVHVPGKVYEYLGAGRPILHLGDHEEDVAARLVRDHRRGVVAGNDAASIGAALAELAAIKREGGWEERFSLGQADVEQYQWRSIARRLHAILQEVAYP
ncbi:glycosyltransferase [Luteimonas dalianensis]|uniref:glycosyltransferase n=1 Tax=Luteimonas dalianensis TaxID=1148196 RepID=UPI003BF10D82